ncbi:sulfatase-like hydrolase/transferase [Pasteurellaceae bacterium HPA106]|uniref:sulfatase-like hydrolase/transferase n=1 Tax=Spirabiliibacterium pneumoniae TaxID=221400 RepID=UPI001AAD8E42|nr:sulfatase-like hydrolase/transferase [Spirabiliibacterium pneumoniae]MBE2897135.1 sulfatase-like hydrolase/transferase [Spirabiliibacterium pneumoniae]
MNNVVYILLDQVRKDMLGAYGHKIVKTPNIDRLAKEGIRFNNAFTPASVCGPARTSLFTGLMPSSHGIIRNGEKGGTGEVSKDQANIADVRGYNTYVVGKWHVGTRCVPEDYDIKGHNFDGYGYPGSGVYKNLVFDQPPTHSNRYKEWLEEKGFDIPEVSRAYFGDNPHLRVQELCGLLSGSKEATIPYFIIDEAKRYIRESLDENKPFFTWVNFWGPHTPCIVPEPYYSMYNPDDVVLDKSFFTPLEGKPGHYKTISKMWGMWSASEEHWKEVICKFWGYITLIDDAIGELFAFLEEKGLYDQTFVVATADHGDAMGAHKMIEKGEFMFETTYNIPMIIKDPQSHRVNEEDDNLIYLHDLTSTVFDIAGQAVPEAFEGESLLPIVREGKNNTRKGVLGQLAGHFVYFEQRMWRRKDYKLVFNASDVCELYDIKNDVEELHNLFYDEAYREVKKEMLEEMYAEMTRLKDPLANWVYRIIDEV